MVLGPLLLFQRPAFHVGSLSRLSLYGVLNSLIVFGFVSISFPGRWQKRWQDAVSKIQQRFPAKAGAELEASGSAQDDFAKGSFAESMCPRLVQEGNVLSKWRTLTDNTPTKRKSLPLPRPSIYTASTSWPFEERIFAKHVEQTNNIWHGITCGSVPSLAWED